MGKSQGEIKREKNAQISRRRFLRNLGMGIGALALASLGGYELLSRGEDERRGFLEREINILPYDWKQVADNYVPLESEKEFNKEDPELHELISIKMPAIQEGCSRKGWKKVSIFGTEQHYGMPEEAIFAEPYKNYLEKGIEYVHRRLPQLEVLPLELVILKKGQDFSGVKRGRGFIGHSFHTVQRIYVDDEKTGEKSVVGLNKYRSGAITKIQYNKEKDKIEDYLVFFGTGNEAILAPISEALHLSLTQFTQRHFDRLGGFRESQTAEESIVEGISFIIGQDFVRKEGIPGYEEKINKMLADMKKEPRYRFVPTSIEWLRRNGIEQGLALYMEDPRKYLEAIQRQ